MHSEWLNIVEVVFDVFPWLIVVVNLLVSVFVVVDVVVVVPSDAAVAPADAVTLLDVVALLVDKVLDAVVDGESFSWLVAFRRVVVVVLLVVASGEFDVTFGVAGNLPVVASLLSSISLL